ncbi:hypothetical protein BJ912DRAFT_1058828 [Pholiota molesta]|nr:hypothetical protein BJ912DRAFT_1058828 [Pholiota molesta]
MSYPYAPCAEGSPATQPEQALLMLRMGSDAISTPDEAIELLQEAYRRTDAYRHQKILAAEKVRQARMEEETVERWLCEAESQARGVVDLIKCSGFQLSSIAPGFFRLIYGTTPSKSSAKRSTIPPPTIMPTSRKRPGDDLGANQNPTSPKRQPKTLRAGPAADAPSAASMQSSRTSALDPPAAHVELEKENDTPAADSNKRPTRTTRGVGGRAVQLQKAVESIRPDLDPKTGSKKQSALAAAWAPSHPVPSRMKWPSSGASTPAQKIAAHKLPIRPDPPLQPAPVPILQHRLPGSQYGLQIQAPTAHGEFNASSQFARNDKPEPRNNYPSIQHNEGSNVNDRHAAAHDHNANVQYWAQGLQHPRENEETAPEQRPAGQEDGSDNSEMYGAEGDNHSQEHAEDATLAQAGAPSYQDDPMGEGAWPEGNFEPLKFYFKDGVGLVPIDTPEDEQAPQDDDYAGPADMNNGLGDLPSGFDQNSPSEDEANFQAALHPDTFANPQPTAGDSNESGDDGDGKNDVRDVLQEHRNHNRANRAPNPQRMYAFAEQQSANRAAIQVRNGWHDRNMGNGHLDNVDADYDADGAVEEGVLRHEGEPGFKPHALCSYPPDWRAILASAKRRWQRSIVLEQSDPFPERDLSAEKIRELIWQIVAERRAEGEEVFNEGATFRCRLKKMAVNVVEMHYHTILKPDTADIPGQLERQRITQDSINSVLEGLVFHRGVLDVNGKIDNIAHPSIPALIHKFFYGGNESLAATFPDDFSEKVPENAIALVMACIKNVLEEWSRGITQRSSIPFTTQGYRPSFYGMMMAISDVKPSAYHHQKFEINRARWAQQGMRQSHDVLY